MTNARKLAVLALCLAFSSCSPPTPAQKAFKKLKETHQAFTTEDFLKAAQRGDVDAVHLFIQAGIDYNSQDAAGRTALMAAAEAGRGEVVKALLDENAKTDLVDKEGSTALFIATAADQAEVVRQLIESNADVTLRNHNNWSPLMRAVFDNHPATVQVFLTTSQDRLMHNRELDRGLLVAAYLGNNELIRALLTRGANVNAALEQGQTPLMCAAAAGKADTVLLLLEHNADTRLVNSEGATAAQVASERGFMDLAKVIERGNGSPAAPIINPVIAASQVPAPEDEDQAREAAEQAARAGAEKTGLKQNNLDSNTADLPEVGLDSDPTDPNSHPPYYTKLHYKKIAAQVFPVTLEAIENDGKNARVKLRNEDEVLVAVGEQIPGLPYKVERIRPRTANTKDTGKWVDASEVTLTQMTTGKKVVLVKGLPTNSPNTRAGILFDLPGHRPYQFDVEVDQEFTLPTDEKMHYQVVDIRSTQLVLRVAETNQTLTLPLEKR